MDGRSEHTLHPPAHRHIASVSRGPQPGDWDKHKEEIKRLYLGGNFSLRSVKHLMDEKYKFGATERMYKTRLGQWGLRKRTAQPTEKPSQSMERTPDSQPGLTSRKRKSRGDEHPTRDTDQPLAADSKAEQMEEDKDMTDSYVMVDRDTQSAKIPSSDTRNDKRNASRLIQVPSPVTGAPPTSRTLGTRFNDNRYAQRPPQRDESPHGAHGSLHSIHFTEARWNNDQPKSFGCDIEKLEKNLEHVSNHFCSLAGSPGHPGENQNSPSGLTPAMEETLNIVTPILMSPRHSSIHRMVAAPSSPSESQNYSTPGDRRLSLPYSEMPLPNLGPARRNEEAHSDTAIATGHLSGRWLSYGFMAAFYCHEGCYTSYHDALRNATETFNEMITSKDPQILTSQIALMSILHCVGQQDIAFILIHNAYMLLRAKLPPKAPILVVAEGLKNLAIKNNSEYPFAADLRSAYIAISEELGRPSPNAIAALYAWSFCQLYKQDYEPAKPNLEELYKVASATLSQTHLVTIAALTARARVSTHLKDHKEALGIHRRAEYTSRCVLGVKHPMHLECCRRLSDSVLVELEGHDDERLEIKRQVFQHRFTMLGPHHPYTNASKESLVQFLKEKGRPEDVIEVDNLMKNAEKHSSWKVEVWTSY